MKQEARTSKEMNVKIIRLSTSEDVIATWDLRMDETILSPFEQITYGKFERPVAESKYIVSVKAKTVNWRNFLYFSTMVLHPNHILKDLDGTAFLEEYAFSVIPGTGPYKISESDIKNQESYTLKRREAGWPRQNWSRAPGVWLSLIHI